MKKSKVFEETSKKYLSRISDTDLSPRAIRLGAEFAGDALIIPYYETPFRVTTDGVFAETGKQANFAVSVVLFQYVLHCPAEIPVAVAWVTFREFKDSGPLGSYFTSNNNNWMMIHPGIFPWNSICCLEYRSVFGLTVKTMNFRRRAPSCSGNPPSPISIWKVWPSARPI